MWLGLCRARRDAAAGKWAKAKRLVLQLFAGNEVVSVCFAFTLKHMRWQAALLTVLFAGSILGLATAPLGEVDCKTSLGKHALLNTSAGV